MEDQIVQEIRLKKQSLKRYRNTLSCIDRLGEKLILLEERIKTVRSPNYSGMPRGGTPVTIEDLLSDKEDLIKRIRRMNDKARRLKNQIVEEIDLLEDPRHCEILEAYFIDRKSIAEISEDMGYTERHVYDLYRSAIYELTFNETT